MKERVARCEQDAFYILEGDFVKDFRSFTANIKVIPNKGGNGGIVKWTVEFEKISANVPAADSYMTLAEKLNKDVDAHLQLLKMHDRGSSDDK